MSRGCLIAVVGPSGVGKDSVMAALAEAAPHIGIVRRVITRDAEAGGEDFDAVSEAEFAIKAAAGAFCLHWQAHGLSYGIPVEVEAEVAAGETCLVNLSRSVLSNAAARFPDFLVLNLTATPETLAARLAGRGRETAEDIARRLARRGVELPSDLPVLTISNDGALEETVATALRALKTHPQKV